MTENKWQWWMIVAVLIAVGEVVLSVGNLVSYFGKDNASLSSSLLSAALGLGAATLIVGGLLFRRSGRSLGSFGVAAGVLPGCVGLMFWWFPPAIGIGAISIAVVLLALADATRSGRTALSRPTTS